MKKICKKRKKQTIRRSSETGRFVSKAYLLKHPRTTETENR